MLDKKLTVILCGADRELWRGDPVQLRVIDPNGSAVKRLANEKVDERIVDLNLQLPFDAGQTYVRTLAATIEKTQPSRFLARLFPKGPLRS